MDKQPVGQLPDLTQSNNNDEIMVITNDEYNQLKKEKISDFITDLTSTDENNALVKGTDGKLFTKDFGNASNITEGTLPVDVLPESGVTADTYAYPSSVTVNAQGMVTAIEEGSPSGANANTDLSNITEAGKEGNRLYADGYDFRYYGAGYSGDYRGSHDQSAADTASDDRRAGYRGVYIQPPQCHGRRSLLLHACADCHIRIEEIRDKYVLCGKYCFDHASSEFYFSYGRGS